MFRPVDLQTMLPRSMDVQKVQGVHHNRPGVDQHEFSKQLAHQSQVQQEQVQHNEASGEGGTIRREGSDKDKRRNPKYNRYRNVKKEEPKPERSLDSERGQHLDLKL